MKLQKIYLTPKRPFTWNCSTKNVLEQGSGKWIRYLTDNFLRWMLDSESTIKEISSQECWRWQCHCCWEKWRTEADFSKKWWKCIHGMAVHIMKFYRSLSLDCVPENVNFKIGLTVRLCISLRSLWQLKANEAKIETAQFVQHSHTSQIEFHITLFILNVFGAFSL